MTHFREIDAIEQIMADILGLLGSEHGGCIATERFEPFNPKLAWVHLARREGGIIGLAWGACVHRGAALARTLSLGRRLRRSGLSEVYLVAESFGPVSPRLQRVMEGVTGRLPQPVRVAVAEDIRCANNQKIGPITELILEAALAVRVELVGVTGGLVCGSKVFFDALRLIGDGRRFCSRNWRVETEMIVMTVEEEMQGETRSTAEFLATEVHVVVDIGAFQMTLGDLLGLRPGSKVELPFTGPLRGILKVDGAALGLATLTWAPNTLMATLDEVNLFGGTQKKFGEIGNANDEGTITEGAPLFGRGIGSDSSERTLEET